MNSRETLTAVLILALVIIGLGLTLALASGPSVAERNCLALLDSETAAMAATCRSL